MISANYDVLIFFHSVVIYAKTYQKSRPTQQNMRHLWPPIHMAKKMGKGVGSGQILL